VLSPTRRRAMPTPACSSSRSWSSETLRITVDPSAPALNPPAYRLDALDDEEVEVLGQLSAKTIEGPTE
jgi:hypothetical protein